MRSGVQGNDLKKYNKINPKNSFIRKIKGFMEMDYKYFNFTF